MYFPKINKKLAGALLGGGVAVSLVTIVGVKIQDSVNYKSQVQKYAKVKSRFYEGLQKTGMKGWYLPTWEDERIWDKQHKSFQRRSPKDKQKFPTSSLFRDHCYKNAEREDFESCTGSNDGWCMDCTRDPEWKND